MDVDAQFPKKLIPEIFRHHQYKVLHGGRGGGKSWAIARALLILGLQRKLRVLCARETQRSIRDSVHKLLVDQIASLGLAGYYNIQQVQITGVNGTEFVFAGLSDQTAASIKSFEAADICWVEEGQVVTENSWTILLPTLFRKDKCELWVSFNPVLDTDPTWKLFVENPPPDTWRVEMNYHDNPWFPTELDAQRIHDRDTRTEYDYNWIWEGKCRPAVSGAVYPEELAELFKSNRVGEFPVASELPIYAALDLGWNDRTAIVIGQKQGSARRIIDYIENDHRAIDWYSAELRNKTYKVSQLFLPHDGAHNHLTGESAQRQFEDLNWRVTILPKTPVEPGINAVRLAFRSLYFNRSTTDRLLECLKRYRRIIPVTTGEPSTLCHNEFSHGADAMRYFCMADAYMGEMFSPEGGLRLPPLQWKWKATYS